MFESKYSKLLTVVLIIVIILIIGLLGFLGYETYQAFVTKKASLEIAEQFEQEHNIISVKDNENISNEDVAPVLDTENVEASSGSTRTEYNGYSVVGTIEIPAINLKYPVLEKATGTSIEYSVAIQYGPGLNKIGNTVIVGHNYRNGSFFGSNSKLKLGDKIYITDESGTRIQYNIYNIYKTSPEDADYMTRDTNGKREVSLSTCTSNSKERLIIWAVEE